MRFYVYAPNFLVLAILKSACFDKSLFKKQCSEDEAKMIIKSPPIDDPRDKYNYKSITSNSNFDHK